MLRKHLNLSLRQIGQLFNQLSKIQKENSGINKRSESILGEQIEHSSNRLNGDDKRTQTTKLSESI